MAFQAINNSATPPAQDPTSSDAQTKLVESKESQPEIKSEIDAETHSPAADDSTQNPSADASLLDPSSYGTRSRNRNGNARPNYSEDQEYDYDFVSSAATTTANPTKKSQNGADITITDAKRIATTNNTSQANGATDSAANPKKRKAATTTSSTQSATATNTPTNGNATAALRKNAPSTNTTVTHREINMLTFTKSKACLNKKGELMADDGTKLCVDDHVYLVCEPPGEPYYLCRIMEFLHSEGEDSPIDSIRVNWYYRPRDVQRFNNDSRLVYATMHSDMCPITSLRGKCNIKHRSEIQDLEAYRKERDSFYFIQVFDRFIRRWYECIPTSAITNVPEKVKKALDERWKFVVVEIGRVKELTSAVKTCKRCTRYCASQDSVDCAICGCSYHMNCVQPPLPKKPSRGFAWACGPCSRASEQKMEARNTPALSGGENTDAEDNADEEGEEAQAISNESTRAPSLDADAMDIDDAHSATQDEIAMAKMWPMRYLGIHCRVEDALQYDDRAIYPRASSRLGPRHQALIGDWYGRPVELVKPIDIKKKFLKGGSQKKDGKLSKETVAAIEADRVEKANRPKWVQDEPAGYVARGEDYPNDDPRCTAKVIWKMPSTETANLTAAESTPAELEKRVVRYTAAAKPLARKIGVPPFGINFLDKVYEIYYDSNYDDEVALAKVAKISRTADLHEPVLTKPDLLKFEEGVAKYGSEHRLIRLHMKTALPHADIVRFYYLWKKTPKGREIWGNFPGRKGKKRIESDAAAKLHDEVAHAVDDSAYDNEKASKHKRAFICKFCNTVHSRQWRRAPGAAPGQTILTDARSGNKEKKERLLVALCLRCANLWRKYAIQWEDLEEINRKVNSAGGKALKRRIDEELLREINAANEAASATPEPGLQDGDDRLAKKAKTDGSNPQKKPVVRPPTPEPPPIVPVQPQWRVLPCAACHQTGGTISCVCCNLTVHRNCFGLPEPDLLIDRVESIWTCEQCMNDRNPQVSTEYSCTLCLTEVTDVDLVEPPKNNPKKKTDRDREKERMEKELADAMRLEYNNKQLALSRPLLPREPLKRTTGNNWVHVYCAVWTPEIRFSNAKALEVAEGFQLIPPARHEAICKLCKNKDHQNKVRNDKGACVNCFQCQTPFHVSCAFEKGYQFGFDVTPVKGSRKDQITTATIGGETGAITAAIWCKEHVVKTIIHPMHEVDESSGKTALQIYIETYKQADLTLTGTVRKAQLAQLTKDKGQLAVQAAQNNSRRESGAHSIAAAVKRGARTSTVSEIKPEDETTSEQGQIELSPESERTCVKCHIDVTPRWHEVDEMDNYRALLSVSRPMLNGDARVPRPMQMDHIMQSTEHTNGVNTSRPTTARGPSYLCHKCFLKRKLDPSPPPTDPPARGISPRPAYPARSDWNGLAPAVAPPQPMPLPRSPWQEATRPSQAQPPLGAPLAPTSAIPQAAPVNSYSHPPPFVPPPPPSSHVYNGTSYHQNGFTGPGASSTPSATALGPPPPVHDGRPPHYPYHGAAPPPYPPSRPASLGAGFLPSGPPITNGIGSPRASSHPPLPSPTFHHPRDTSHGYQPRPSEPPFPTQLPSLGQPANSTPSPALNAGPTSHQSMNIAPGMSHGSPAMANLQARPPSTPRESQDDTRGTPAPGSNGPNGIGSAASASPSLRNLLS